MGRVISLDFHRDRKKFWEMKEEVKALQGYSVVLLDYKGEVLEKYENLLKPEAKFLFEKALTAFVEARVTPLPMTRGKEYIVKMC